MKVDALRRDKGQRQEEQGLSGQRRIQDGQDEMLLLLGIRQQEVGVPEVHSRLDQVHLKR